MYKRADSFNLDIDVVAACEGNNVGTGEVLYADTGWQAYSYGTSDQYRNCPSGYSGVLKERTSNSK